MLTLQWAQPFIFVWASGEVGESHQTVNLTPMAE